MQYPVPKELTKGNFEIGWNDRLSELDTLFVKAMYPSKTGASISVQPSSAASGVPGNVLPVEFPEPESMSRPWAGRKRASPGELCRAAKIHPQRQNYTSGNNSSFP